MESLNNGVGFSALNRLVVKPSTCNFFSGGSWPIKQSYNDSFWAEMAARRPYAFKANESNRIMMVFSPNWLVASLKLRRTCSPWAI